MRAWRRTRSAICPLRHSRVSHSGDGRKRAWCRVPDLPLDASLLPARLGRAERRVDQETGTHPLEAGVDRPVAPDRDLARRRRHVVADPPHGLAAEGRKGPVVRVEHHFLRLARLAADERHAAVAERELRHLHHLRHAREPDPFMAPVELEGLAGIEGQRHAGLRQPAALPRLPSSRMAPNRVATRAAALIAELLPDGLERLPVPLPAVLAGPGRPSSSPMNPSSFGQGWASLRSWRCAVASPRTTLRTVFPASPRSRATDRIDRPSARHFRRIFAIVSTTSIL